MKKNTLLISFSLLLLSIYSSKTQPVLTATGINPVIGNTFTSNSTNYVSPGSPGANQTWDLSSMLAGSPTVGTAIAPASTPYASSFPMAIIAYNSSGIYQYLKASSTAFSNAGAALSGLVIAYSDME